MLVVGRRQNTATRPGCLACVVVVAWIVALSAPGRALGADKQTCVAAYEQGQELRNQARLRAAAETFAVCAQDSCPVLVRSDCVTWLREVQARLPTVIVHARDAAGHDLSDVSMSVDGAIVAESLDGRAIAVDPGRHTFRWTWGHEPPVEQQVVVNEGEKDRVVPLLFESAASEGEPDAHRTSPGLPVGSYVLGGAGIVAAGLSTVFEVLGFTGLSGLYRSCAPNCSRSTVDGYVTDLRIGDVAGGVGLAAIGGAVWLALAQPKVTTAGTGLRVTPLPFAGGGGAGVDGSF